MMTDYDKVVKGPLSLTEAIGVRGRVDGNVIILGGGDLILYGTVAGDVEIKEGGIATIYGTIAGCSTMEDRHTFSVL